MSRHYPRGSNFVKKSFYHFFTTDTINWFEERGVKIKKEDDGRMFPVSNSSQSIIDCLLKEASVYRVEIKLRSEVIAIVFSGTGQSPEFNIQLSNGETIHSDYVCIACGGYSKSPMFDWIKNSGHTIEEPVPSLFTFNLPGNPITKLMGVSVENSRIKIKSSKLQEEGPLLITHWGLSGPVVLKLSAWGARELKERNWEFEISVSWLPEFNENNLREKFMELRFSQASQKLFSKNQFGLPQRLWEFLASAAGVKPDQRWADLNSVVQNKFIQLLVSSVYQIKGKTTFKEEFVTAGGIRLNEIDPQTMRSRLIPGLYFAGEVMDVDGITGGFNFQHAWTSGFIAAKLL